MTAPYNCFFLQRSRCKKSVFVLLLYFLFVSCKFSYVQHSLLPLNVTGIVSPPAPTNSATLRTLVGREDAFDTMQKDFLEREGFRDKTSWAHGANGDGSTSFFGP